MRAKTLVPTSAAVLATAIVGSQAARADTLWYRRLRKPPFQPPPVVFPIVWPALYAGTAIASAQTLDALEDAGEPQAGFAGALAANLALNAGWTWMFFRARRPWLATAHSVLLTASTADLTRRAGQVSPSARALLAPYLGWTAFASVLSGSIAWLNRRSSRGILSR